MYRLEGESGGKGVMVRDRGMEREGVNEREGLPSSRCTRSFPLLYRQTIRAMGGGLKKDRRTQTANYPGQRQQPTGIYPFFMDFIQNHIFGDTPGFGALSCY